MLNQTPRMSLNLKQNLVKYTYLLGGTISLGFALIGAILPIMPTTVFLLIALWCFSKSSARLEHWLLTHPKFGHILNNWRQAQVVPRPAKYLAAAGMSVSLIISGIVFSFGWLQMFLTVLFAFICNYLFSKPSTSSEQPNKAIAKKINILLSAISFSLICYWLMSSPLTF
ncbi:YbaN family protein [Pseudoalteromonas umbrosa]|uniref:YbaN family protein n=1 Tax=Pseudoalteromonas umbrosa TaxID=3048489 RepID=UPI0024C3CEDD|nr:YbaN family protein [Pseudoalteromonas sp. B95]MDK1290345.1 YbaN family protein [Pseudoalteromonas sp. B95]